MSLAEQIWIIEQSAHCEMQRVLMTVCLMGLGLVALAVAGMMIQKSVEWLRALVKRFGVISAGILIVLSLPLIHYGSTKPAPQTWRVNWDEGLRDNGTSVTNGTLQLRWTFSGILATDILHVMARENGTTNRYEMVGGGTVGQMRLDLFLGEIATNREYYVYSEYVPPVPVHTNGVYEARGWMRDTTHGDKFISTLVGIQVNGEQIAPPKKEDNE